MGAFSGLMWTNYSLLVADSRLTRLLQLLEQLLRLKVASVLGKILS